MTEPRFLSLGDTALAVEFGDGVDQQINARVMALDQRLAQLDLVGVVETVPTFRSLMVQFDPLATTPEQIRAQILAALDGLKVAELSGKLWRLPTCYEGDYAPDLEDVAHQTGLTAAEVISLHSGIEHVNYMTGFLPGNPYLGDLPEALTIPRRQNPRTRLPRGSVAIAVGLTVIYPVESPGGWNIIGRTPVPLFDIEATPPARIAPGDRVTFEPVSAAEYQRLERAIANGSWRAESEGRS